ncbi:MAG: V-type proton ATPase subunit E [Oscillospiraceae bacterium]|jgi:V/A-type H+-transporting ATPase subunit E|nr:V-type proton ATPase subunit E [Oscillospiraceae bacterium]
MNGIGKIIAHIEAETAAEIAGIKAETAERVAQIDTHYGGEAMTAYRQIVEAGRADAERQSERTYNSAVMRSKKQILAAKQEMVSAAFERAEWKLLELPEPQYAALLAKLAADAAISGDETLIFNPVERGSIGPKIVDAANELLAAASKTAKLTLSAETREISGGVIISGGNIETNCSASALVNQRRNELSPIAARLLFE